MRRILPVLCLVIACLVPALPSASADWSMEGGDAARTSSTPADPSAFPGILWTAPLPGPLLSQPVVSRDPGSTGQATVFAATGGTAAVLSAISTQDGGVRWTSPMSLNVSAPWAFRGEGGLAADGNRVYALVTAQNGTSTQWREILVARIRADGRSAWSFAGSVYGSGATPVMESSPLLVRDLVIFGSGDGHVRALRALTGAVVWDKAPGSGIPLPVAFMPTGDPRAGDLVLAADDAGRVFALDVNGTANGWTADLGARAVSAPVASPAGPFLAVGRRIVALNPFFGTPRWNQSVPSSVSGPLSLGGTGLFFGAADGGVRALDPVNGAFLWVRSLGALQPWIVTTPTRVFVGAGNTMTALNPATGDVSWSQSFASPVTHASVSENATGRGLIYAGLSAPNRLVALRGSSDLRAVDISLTPITNPDVFQASIDATIKNVGDEPVAKGFQVWINDTIGGVSTLVGNASHDPLKPGASFAIHIPSWNFAAGGHTMTLTVESVLGDRNLANNVLSVKFFASAGPPKVTVEWSPAFWVALVVVGAAGVGVGWLVAIAQRRRETELEGMLRERREAGR